MLGHTEKHRIEERSFSDERSESEKSEDSINWRTAANEAFSNLPGIALNLRGLRNREGLTQEQLGQAIGVEQSNISKMERGKRQIGIKIAKRIEEVFNIDYHLFL
ncbi:MAG: helix-turn-helix transcriptional regulator [Parachlamydia sp.]|jgi:DNA-binding XRE family transcriptional regulator|nr:helix-turn-helix transcriptional regulator [Parachlamydia sp.]